MRKRMKVNRKRDKPFFTRTAAKVKAINLPQKTYRGGIRF